MSLTWCWGKAEENKVKCGHVASSRWCRQKTKKTEDSSLHSWVCSIQGSGHSLLRNSPLGPMHHLDHTICQKNLKKNSFFILHHLDDATCLYFSFFPSASSDHTISHYFYPKFSLFSAYITWITQHVRILVYFPLLSLIITLKTK